VPVAAWVIDKTYEAGPGLDLGAFSPQRYRSVQVGPFTIYAPR
jgi:hypothetical protein